MDINAITLFGASGFTGRAVATAAAQQGVKVCALSRRPITIPDDLKDWIDWQPVSAAGADFFSALQGPVDAAIHLAAPSGVIDGSFADDAVKASIASIAALCEAALQTGCKRVIYAGSYWQYGEDGIRPPATTLYSAFKNAGDEIAIHYARRLDIVNLVLFDSYGPGDQRGKVLQLVNEAAASGQTLDMTVGEQHLWPIHSGDLAKAFLAAARLGLNTGLRRFWVPGPQRISLRRMVEQYCEVYGLDVTIKWGRKPYPEHQVFEPWIGDRLPGWQATTGLDEGIKTLHTKGDGTCR